jgi:hypothetical protein
MVNTGTSDRGVCPFCQREFALTRVGTLRRHGAREARRPPLEAQPDVRLCPGSGQAPA